MLRGYTEKNVRLFNRISYNDRFTALQTTLVAFAN
jgi:hypothetical protein